MNPLAQEIELAHKHAAALTVFHIEDLMSTRVPIRLDQIETYPGVEVHHVNDHAGVHQALHALEAAAPKYVPDAAEMRWKLAFLDKAGHRVLEVYLASFQDLGTIGARPVRFAHDTLRKWLHAHVSAKQPAGNGT